MWQNHYHLNINTSIHLRLRYSNVPIFKSVFIFTILPNEFLVIDQWNPIQIRPWVQLRSNFPLNRQASNEFRFNIWQPLYTIDSYTANVSGWRSFLVSNVQHFCWQIITALHILDFVFIVVHGAASTEPHYKTCRGDQGMGMKWAIPQHVRARKENLNWQDMKLGVIRVFTKLGMHQHNTHSNCRETTSHPIPPQRPFGSHEKTRRGNKSRCRRRESWQD